MKLFKAIIFFAIICSGMLFFKNFCAQNLKEKQAYKIDYTEVFKATLLSKDKLSMENNLLVFSLIAIAITIFQDIIPKKLSTGFFLTALIWKFYVKFGEELAKLKKNQQEGLKLVAVQAVVEAPKTKYVELERIISPYYFINNEAAILSGFKVFDNSEFEIYENNVIEIKKLSDYNLDKDYNVENIKNNMQNIPSQVLPAENYPFADPAIPFNAFNFSLMTNLFNFNGKAIKYDYIILNSKTREQDLIHINLIFSDANDYDKKYYLVLQAKAFEDEGYKEDVIKGTFIYREQYNIKFLKEAKFAQNYLEGKSLNSIIVEEAKRILQLLIKIDSKDKFVIELPNEYKIHSDSYSNIMLVKDENSLEDYTDYVYNYKLICNCLSCIYEYEQDAIISLKKQVSNQEKKFKLLFEFIKSTEYSDESDEKLYQKVTFAEVHN